MSTGLNEDRSVPGETFISTSCLQDGWEYIVMNCYGRRFNLEIIYEFSVYPEVNKLPSCLDDEIMLTTAFPSTLPFMNSFSTTEGSFSPIVPVNSESPLSSVTDISNILWSTNAADDCTTPDDGHLTITTGSDSTSETVHSIR